MEKLFNHISSKKVRGAGVVKIRDESACLRRWLVPFVLKERITQLERLQILLNL